MIKQALVLRRQTIRHQWRTWDAHHAGIVAIASSVAFFSGAMVGSILGTLAGWPRLGQMLFGITTLYLARRSYVTMVE